MKDKNVGALIGTTIAWTHHESIKILTKLLTELMSEKCGAGGVQGEWPTPLTRWVVNSYGFGIVYHLML